jgi:hypothetical protein
MMQTIALTVSAVSRNPSLSLIAKMKPAIEADIKKRSKTISVIAGRSRKRRRIEPACPNGRFLEIAATPAWGGASIEVNSCTMHELHYIFSYISAARLTASSEMPFTTILAGENRIPNK